MKELHISVFIIPAVMLLLALFHWPYGYYTLLRLVVFTSIGYIAFTEYKENKEWNWLISVYALIILLFNPIFPIGLKKEMWSIINIVVSVFLFSVLYKNSQKER